MAIPMKEGPVRAIDRLLRDGEVIFARTRVHWLVFIPPIVRLGLLGVALAALWSGAFAGPESFFVENVMGVRLGYALLCAVILGWNGVKYWTTELAVTNQRFLFLKRELSGQRVIEIPLGEAADIRCSYSGLQRRLGGGRVHVYSSGGGGIQTPPVYRPDAFERSAEVQLKKVSG